MFIYCVYNITSIFCCNNVVCLVWNVILLQFIHNEGDSHNNLLWYLAQVLQHPSVGGHGPLVAAAWPKTGDQKIPRPSDCSEAANCEDSSLKISAAVPDKCFFLGPSKPLGNRQEASENIILTFWTISCGGDCVVNTSGGPSNFGNYLVATRHLSWEVKNGQCMVCNWLRDPHGCHRPAFFFSRVTAGSGHL